MKKSSIFALTLFGVAAVVAGAAISSYVIARYALPASEVQYVESIVSIFFGAKL